MLRCNLFFYILWWICFITNNCFINNFFTNFCSFFYFCFKTILLSSISVIAGYFAMIFPFSNFSSTGSGCTPSAFKLSFTNSRLLGNSSSIVNTSRRPSLTLFLNVIRYSTSSPNFGDLLEAIFLASISPGTSFGIVTVTFASSSLSYFISALSCPFTATTFLLLYLIL